MTVRSTMLIALPVLAGLAGAFGLAWKEMNDWDAQKEVAETSEYAVIGPGEILSPAEILDLKLLDARKPRASRYYAGSRLDWDAIRMFGWHSRSFNKPRLLGSRTDGVPGKLTLEARVDKPMACGNHRGFEVLLVNRSGTEIALKVDCASVPIVMEATNPDGEWKPIEFVTYHGCGNSIHRVFLPDGHFWRFAAPVYRGTLKCRQRLVLQTRTPIYSAEFDGMVNPEQFKTVPAERLWISEIETVARK